MTDEIKPTVYERVVEAISLMARTDVQPIQVRLTQVSHAAFFASASPETVTLQANGDEVVMGVPIRSGPEVTQSEVRGHAAGRAVNHLI